MPEELILDFVDFWRWKARRDYRRRRAARLAHEAAVHARAAVAHVPPPADDDNLVASNGYVL